MKAIKEIFDNHPTETEVHVTSDGIMFFQKHYAEAHSKNLENKEVVTHSRESLATAEAESNKLADAKVEADKLAKEKADADASTEDATKSKTKKTK